MHIQVHGSKSRTRSKHHISDARGYLLTRTRDALVALSGEGWLEAGQGGLLVGLPTGLWDPAPAQFLRMQERVVRARGLTDSSRVTPVCEILIISPAPLGALLRVSRRIGVGIKAYASSKAGGYKERHQMSPKINVTKGTRQRATRLAHPKRQVNSDPARTRRSNAGAGSARSHFSAWGKN